MADNVLIGSRRFLVIVTAIIASFLSLAIGAPSQDKPGPFIPRSRPLTSQGWKHRYLQKLLSRLEEKHSLLRQETLTPELKSVLRPTPDAIPITLNLCDVSISWKSLAKELEATGTSATGYTVGLMQDEAYIHYNMLIGKEKSSFRFSDLTNGVVYSGFIKSLNNTYKVHHFIRGYDLYSKSPQTKDDAIHEFQLTAPYVIGDEHLHEQLLKTSGGRNSTKPSPVELEGVDLKVRFTRMIEDLGFLLEVSRYSLGRTKGGNGTFIVVTPSQIVQLLPPIKIVTLSRIERNELIRVTLKRISSVNEHGDILMENVNYINIYTGDVSTNVNASLKQLELFRSAAELLENETAAAPAQDAPEGAEPLNDIFGLGFGNSGFGNGFGGLFSNFLRPTLYNNRRNSVRCYANGDVFEGYACRNSDICVPIEWQCDGEEDCANGDDEFRCNSVNGYYNNPSNNYYNRGQCRRHEFRCRSRGQSLCLPNSWLCDGRVDCEDGWDEDEFNCGNQYSQFTPGHTTNFYTNNYDRDCADSWFNCWDNRDCIHPRYVCDNEDDCRDGSDERICASWNRQCDNHYEFRCASSVGGSHASYTNRACIPKSWICDDQQDCPRGEDESLVMCRDYLRDHPPAGNDQSGRPIPIRGELPDKPRPL